MSTVDASISDLLSQTSTLEAELDGWQSEKARLEERIAARQRLLAALRSEAELRGTTLFDPPPAQATGSSNGSNSHANGKVEPLQRNKTGHAIMAVLRESSRPLSAEDVFAALDRRGQAPLSAQDPLNSVRSALWYLAKQGKIDKLGSTPADRRWATKTSPPKADGPEGVEDVG